MAWRGGKGTGKRRGHWSARMAWGAQMRTTTGALESQDGVGERGEGGRRAMLRFEVSDTGVGINQEAQARLFQPFTQVHFSQGSLLYYFIANKDRSGAPH